jgi:hypothetical protein
MLGWLRSDTAGALVATALAVTFGPACSGNGRARDVAGERRPGPRDTGPSGGTTVPEAPRSELTSARTDRPRVIARATARALAVDAWRIYYGNSDDDGVYSVAKTGGQPLRIARHAPVSGALALDGTSITWIASPGDAVLRAPITGGVQPTTLRDRGIFASVATVGDDTFITEAIGAGGALIRVTGATASRLAAFDGPPRAVLADETHAFVVTPTTIYKTPHQRGELEPVATGSRFNHAVSDETFLYVLAEIDKARAVVRFPKAGGPMTVIARDVRDAPIDVEGSEVFFFDAVKPQVRRVPASGGESRVVVEDEGLAVVSAIDVDATTIYVAQGSHESGAIVGIPRPKP